MAEQLLFQARDHVNRSWKVTHRPGLGSKVLVTFRCVAASGRSCVLDQTASWHPTTGWDMTRWFPSSPRPVPEAVLAAVEAKLREVAA